MTVTVQQSQGRILQAKILLLQYFEEYLMEEKQVKSKFKDENLCFSGV